MSLIDVLNPSLTLEQGLALLRDHRSTIDVSLSQQLSVRAHQFISAPSSPKSFWDKALAKLPKNSQPATSNLAIAEKFYRWAVAAGEIIGSMRVIVACSYDLAELLEHIEKPLEAVEFYRKALPHFIARGEARETITIYGRIAKCYEKAGLIEAAVRELKQAEQVSADCGFGHTARINLSPVLIRLLTIQEKTYECQLATEALVKTKQALARVDFAKFDEAMKLCSEGKINTALALHRKAEGPLLVYGDRADQASASLNFGVCLSKAAEYAEATTTLQKALQIFAEIGAREGVAKARKNLASNFDDQGLYQAALDEYREALRLFEELDDIEAVARTMNDLGVLHKNLNLLLDAFRYYIAVREVFTNESGSNSLRDLQGNLDTIFSKLRIRLSPELADRAINLFQQGALIELARLLEIGSAPWNPGATGPSSDPASSTLDSNALPEKGKVAANQLLLLARSYLATGDINKAVQEMWGAATTAQYAERDFDKAITLFYEAGSLCEAHGLNHSLIRIGHHLGDCLSQAGQLVEAQSTLEETIQEAKDRNALSVLWQARSSLAHVYRRLGQPNEAINQLSTAIEEIEQQTNALNHVRTAEAFLEDKMPLYQTLVDLLVERKDEKAAYEVVLRAKSNTFTSFYQRVRSARPIGAAGTTQAGVTEENCSKRKSLKHYSVDADHSIEWLSEWEELRMWAQESEKRWKVSSDNAARVATLQAVQGKLDEDTALIDFFFTGTKLYIFTITEESFACTSALITQKEISDALESVGFMDTITGKRGLYAIAKVRKLLLEWLGFEFTTTLMSRSLQKLCLCPHGILHLLPLTPAIQESLARKHTDGSSDQLSCWYVPNASFVTSLDGSIGNSDFIYFGIGNPDSTLKGASEEVTKAGRFFTEKQRRVITDRFMSRDSVLAEMQFADVIHFACHGFLRSDIPELSYLKLGEREYLRAIDILSRGRTKAKLVILSACWTSVGRVTASDEIASLSRAFLLIGAEAVLASLWPLNDRLTTAFIGDFFQHWVCDQNSLRVALSRTQQLYGHEPDVTWAFVLTTV